MTSKTLLKYVILLKVFLIIIAFNYEIVTPDENFYKSCEEDGVHYYSDYIVISNLYFDTLANESVYIHGFLSLIRDIGESDNPGSFQFYKKKRGVWVSTIYSFRMEDLCKRLFNPTEIWSRFLEHVEPSQRKCPFFKGQIIHLDDTSSLKVSLPDPRLDGEYKIQVIFTFTDLNEIFCCNIYFDVYRV